jgi:hypothetical protein
LGICGFSEKKLFNKIGDCPQFIQNKRLDNLFRILYKIVAKVRMGNLNDGIWGGVVIYFCTNKIFYRGQKSLTSPTVIILFSRIDKKERILVFKGDKLSGVGPTDTCENIYP